MRHSLSLILIALVSFATGVGIGIGISWGILPVRSEGATPAVLNETSKDTFRLFVADSYHATRDLLRAQIRLELIDGVSATIRLEDQVHRLNKEKGDDNASLKLLDLQIALTGLHEKTKQGLQITAMVTGEASPVGTKILAQGDTLSILTGRPPTLTAAPPVRQTIFTIRNRTPICELSLAAPLLQMMVYDQSGNPASGVAIIISSSEGKERILTGLKPERGAGYMDLILNPGILYSFIIEGADGNSETISVSDCSSTDGSTYPGGWLFEIQLGNR